MSDRAAQKRAAAARAVALIESGMRVGLGTGSTAWHVVDLLGTRLQAGELRNITAVPTSRATEEQARSLEIPVASLDQVTSLDLTIDGTDEVDPQLDLIKGLGGALLWEKIVAHASARFVIVADDSKEVDRLGARAPLPVEVVPFGWRTHLAVFEALGARPVLRVDDRNSAFVTDGEHYIVDLHFADGIDDAALVEAELRSRAGIVETGLFLDMADTVMIATANGVRVRERSAA
ncbi:MAG TPA: ribose-5-phosphate isomerase RpiA [Longimicrobiales bacterium]|nr:ribose-5-phosphate isomerase RpiA [Longimicrobiales bacterium]